MEVIFLRNGCQIDNCIKNVILEKIDEQLVISFYPRSFEKKVISFTKIRIIISSLHSVVEKICQLV